MVILAKDSSLLVNDDHTENNVVSTTITNFARINNTKTRNFFNRDLKSPLKQALSPAVKPNSLYSNNNDSALPVPSRTSTLIAEQQQRDYSNSSSSQTLIITDSFPRLRKTMKSSSCASVVFDTTPREPQVQNSTSTANGSRFSLIAAHQFDADSYEKQRKMLQQQSQTSSDIIEPAAGGALSPLDANSGSLSPTTAANRAEFMRNFVALSRRLKEQDATNNPETVQAMREFLGEHLLELMDKLKTSTSNELKEELLSHLRDFMKTATAAQLRTVLKLSDFYDSVCDCMNLFMRRRNSYEQGLSATIDILKMCAVQDKKFGSIMRRNDGIKLLCIAAKYFLGSTVTKRFLALVFIMRRLAANPRNVIIMWHNGTIKSFLLTIFASPTVGGPSSNAPSSQNGNGIRPTTSNSTTSSSSPIVTPTNLQRLRSSSSTSASTLSTASTLLPAAAGGRVVKDLLNILIIASKRSRALRSGLVEEIMRSMVRYLSTLRLPEDLKSRSGTVRLCAIIVRNLLSTKVGRKTFRAFRGIEAVCAICDATRSMTLVHLCGQILVAQKIPKRLPLRSHRHPCQVPVIVAGQYGSEDFQMLTSVEDIAKITALAGCVPAEGSNGSVSEKLMNAKGSNDRFLATGDDEDNRASSSEDDDEDIEPLRRQRYLTSKGNNNDDEEDEDVQEDVFDEEEDEEFEDEEEEEDEEKTSPTTASHSGKVNMRRSFVDQSSTALTPKPSSSDNLQTKKDPYNYGPNYDFLAIDVRSVDESVNTYTKFFAEQNVDQLRNNATTFLAHTNAEHSNIAPENPVPPLLVTTVRQPNLVRELFRNDLIHHVLPFSGKNTPPTSDPSLIPFAASGSSQKLDENNYPLTQPPFNETLHRGSLKGRKSILREDLLRLADPNTLIDKVVYDLDSHFCDGNYSAPIENFEVNSNSAPVDAKKDVPSLRFSGMFECGNLRKAIQIRDTEYDLLIEPDVNNDRRIQWFYFSVENMLAGVPYRFNIINCEKETSQFNEGQQPIMFSLKDREQGWYRTGSRVFYYRNMYRRNGKRNLPCRSTTFTITFPHADDVCYIAYHFPYSYSMLLYDLDRWRDIASQPANNIYMQAQPLAHTLCGNSLHLVTITSRNQLSAIAKRSTIHDDNGGEIPKPNVDYVVLTGRVHPSESNSSFIMQGCIDFLLSSHPVAKALLERYVFKIVPMLNPDGVINGMTRGTMSTVDLNRTWVRPHKILQPETYHTKGLLSYMCNVLGVKPFLFLDLHGHSRMKNVFLYGCDPNQDWYTQMYAELLAPEMLLREPEPDLTLFASTMADICPAFSLFGSSFKVTLVKEPSARVVLWRQLQCARSFTLESTFCGFDSKSKLNGRQINQRDLHTIGRDLMRTLFKITKWPVESKPSLQVSISTVQNDAVNSFAWPSHIEFSDKQPGVTSATKKNSG